MTKQVDSVLSCYIDTGTICEKKKTFASRNFHNLAFDHEIANFLPLKISCYADDINTTANYVIHDYSFIQIQLSSQTASRQ